MFSDESSVEIFLNHGECAFTSRIYDQEQRIVLESNIHLKGSISEAQSFEIDFEPALKK
ncbi:GH32 C-terminal domain-containing protein [Ileibacterium valens]|uniref:GH32 C-terminal domain-containing protein n=1 Tax=Ileibacterium valens TaxID=1862668 RepID=UPI00333F34F9